jgi:biopolymer transport protein ExbD
MKFPRNAKILGSYFDAAPVAAVFFVLVIFLLLSALLPVPGLRMKLNPPAAADLPGISQRIVAMAVDADGRLYFKNQIVTETQLKAGLVTAVRNAHEPLTLVIHADRAVSYGTLARLALLAREPEAGIPGITNLLLATLPRVEDAPAPR